MAPPITLLGLALVYWLFLASRLLAVVMERHPEIYESLGRPSRLLVTTPLATGRFLAFVAGGQFKAIDDAPLVRLCGFLRVFLLLLALGMLAAIAFPSA